MFESFYVCVVYMHVQNLLVHKNCAPRVGIESSEYYFEIPVKKADVGASAKLRDTKNKTNNRIFPKEDGCLDCLVKCGQNFRHQID